MLELLDRGLTAARRGAGSYLAFQLALLVPVVAVSAALGLWVQAHLEVVTVAAYAAAIFLTNALAATATQVAIARGVGHGTRGAVALARETQRRYGAALVAALPSLMALAAAACAVLGYGAAMTAVITGRLGEPVLVATLGGLAMTGVLVVALWIALRYGLAPTLVALEELKGRESWRRSAERMQGRMGRAALLWVVHVSLVAALVTVGSLVVPQVAGVPGHVVTVVVYEGVAAVVGIYAFACWAVYCAGMGESISRRPR